MLDKIGGLIGGYFGGPAGAAIGTAAGGFLGDAGSAYGAHREAEMTRSFNADQANLSRESQLELANTQYQRTVKDLNAAGLSPMLAYTKGASAMPSAVTASSGAQGDAPRFGESAQRASASDLAREQIEVAKSQREVNVQTAKKVAEEAKLAAQRVLQEPARFYYEQAESGSRINSNSAQTVKTDIDARNNEALRTPSSDPYWYRDIKEGGKRIFNKFLEKNKSFPWSLEGRRK
jgi:hypothetical protein